MKSFKEDDKNMKKKFGFNCLASVALLGVATLAGCGTVTTVALESVSFGKEGGYVLVPREARSLKARTLGADAYFCQNKSCKAIPVGNLTDEKIDAKERKKGSIPRDPQFISASGGYVVIPRETQASSFNALFGVATSKSEGSAGADAFYCENLTCQKIPVQP